MRTRPQLGYPGVHFTRFEFNAGDILDLLKFNRGNAAWDQFLQPELTEAHNFMFVLDGVGTLHGPDFSLPVSPGYEFRFGLRGFGEDRLEALTDMTVVCVAEQTLEGIPMYKVKTISTDLPFDVSSQDGMYLCVISGSAMAGESLIETGSRLTLTDDHVRIAPNTDGDRFQCFVVLQI